MWCRSFAPVPRVRGRCESNSCHPRTLAQAIEPASSPDEAPPVQWLVQGIVLPECAVDRRKSGSYYGATGEIYPLTSRTYETPILKGGRVRESGHSGIEAHRVPFPIRPAPRRCPSPAESPHLLNG